VFESVVAITFQINFRAEMYENDFFFKLFLKSAHQTIQNIKKLIFYKKKN